VANTIVPGFRPLGHPDFSTGSRRVFHWITQVFDWVAQASLQFFFEFIHGPRFEKRGGTAAPAVQKRRSLSPESSLYLRSLRPLRSKLFLPSRPPFAPVA